MRIAWLFGVIFFQPRPGLAAPGAGLVKPAAKAPAARRAEELSLLIETGELPPIAPAPLPERSSPEPVEISGAAPARQRRVFAGARRIRLRGRRLGRARRPVPVPQAPVAALNPAAEVEALGEDLRDAVAPAPSLERFLAALHDPDPRARREAVEAFGYAGNFAAIPYVSAVLLRLDEELSVRVAAARALGRVGDRRAWSFLARAVKDREPQVRLACAVALGRVAGRGGAGPLSRALRSETDENVRAALDWALSAAKGRRFLRARP
jgi:hypothetical protein